MTLLRRLLFTGMLSTGICSVSARADEISDIARQSVQSNFATAALLSDDRVVKLGFWDFDPNEFIGTTNDKLGSEDATALRDSIKQFSFPWQFPLTDDDAKHRWWISSRLAYIEIQQTLFLGANEETEETSDADELSEQVYTLGSGFGYRYRYNKHWDFSFLTNISWMRYRSRLNYTDEDRDVLSPVLDGLLANYDVDMLMVEPILRASYRFQAGETKYKLFSSAHYLTGEPLSTDNPAHDTRPDAWYGSFGFEVNRPFSFFGNAGQEWWLKLSRIELSDDLSQQMGTSHYYEFSIAWLTDMSPYTKYLKNLGVGININYGSALRGGTLILVYHFAD